MFFENKFSAFFYIYYCVYFVSSNYGILRGLFTMFKFSSRPVSLSKYKAINQKYAKDEIHKIELILKKHGFYSEYQGICGSHVGTTAIPGALGKPMIDLVFCTQNMLPKISIEFIEDLKIFGYKYWGATPHVLNKHKHQWFGQHVDDKRMQRRKLGHDGFILHFVDSESKDVLESFINYCEYLKEHKDVLQKVNAEK